IRFEHRVRRMLAPGEQVPRYGQADPLDESVLGPADAGVQHVPAAVMLDDAPGPRGQVIPGTGRAGPQRVGQHRPRPQVGGDGMPDRGIVVPQFGVTEAARRLQVEGVVHAVAARQPEVPYPRVVKAECQLSQPFSEPWSSATTKWRWNTTKTTRVGTRMSSEPAHSSGILVPHCPWKAPSAPAIVRFVGSSTSTIDSR